jgi:hypothetical protein
VAPRVFEYARGFLFSAGGSASPRGQAGQFSFSFLFLFLPFAAEELTKEKDNEE